MIHKNTSKIIIEELGKDCRKCGHCCSYGSGIILEQEIPRISSKFELNEEEFKKKYLEEFECFSKVHHRFKRNKEKDKPYGSCIFLTKDKKCAINDHKPLYCRIANCGPLADDAIQWFHLNHTVDKFAPQTIREWKIYSKDKKVIPGGLVEDFIDRETLEKIKNYDILK